MNYELAQELQDAGFPNIKDCNIGKAGSLFFPMEASQFIHLVTPRMSSTGLSPSWKNSLRRVGNSLTDYLPITIREIGKQQAKRTQTASSKVRAETLPPKP